MAERVVGGRGPDHPGQQRRLGQGEPGRRGREEALGGRLHAVGTLAEVDGVEVRLEDGRLVVAPLQPPGVGGLGQLAPQGPLVRDIGVLHVLLGDGRPALDHPPPLQVSDRRPGHGQPIHPAVPPEPRVLGVDHGQPHPAAHLPQRHRRPVLRPVQGGHRPPLGVQHQRRLRHPVQRHQLERPHRHAPAQQEASDKPSGHHPGPADPDAAVAGPRVSGLAGVGLDPPPGPALDPPPSATLGPCPDPGAPEPRPPAPGPPVGERSPAAGHRPSLVHNPPAHRKVIVGIRGGRLHPEPC
jgi:hypothetical protein